ncbi:MAG: hypothetical protein JKY37_18605, partial [Nannocystaceae bacterium]|nr:hypothetical protein [Nannocystaceae bacterium]
DAAVKDLVRDIAIIGQIPIKVDICMFGICLDYYVDREELVGLIDKLHMQPELGGIKIFPKGIIDPTKFLVQVERAVGH